MILQGRQKLSYKLVGETMLTIYLIYPAKEKKKAAAWVSKTS